MVFSLCELISKAEIDRAIGRLAAEIRRDVGDKNPVFVCILKGSFVFAADLIRATGIPAQVQFVCLSSYGCGMETSGRVKMRLGLREPVAGKHVVVLEDIVDTGATVHHLLKYLARRKPADLKLCVLLDKPSRRRLPVKIDYTGFQVPDRFVVGYGIDWNEDFRYLPDIRYVETETEDG